MSKKIIFTKTEEIPQEYYPKPASTYLPEWYKKTQGYKENKKDIDLSLTTTATIKKCIPVFDALTSGYIIPTYCDLIIKKNDVGDIMYIPALQYQNYAINFHSIIQAPYHPSMNHYAYPKWTNPWSIKTPPGYSSLFIPPVHSGNNFFTVLEGIVDTDTYTSPVNFPFVLNDTNFEGLIPAGTPMVQVIPIKRDIWKMENGNIKDAQKSNETIQRLNSKFFDRYKNMFWNRKEYK